MVLYARLAFGFGHASGDDVGQCRYTADRTDALMIHTVWGRSLHGFALAMATWEHAKMVPVISWSEVLVTFLAVINEEGVGGAATTGRSGTRRS